MRQVRTIADVVIALALVAWVGGHAALGAFAARIVFRDLPRPLAASTMSTIFSSFDSLIIVMAVLLALALVARGVVRRDAWSRADWVVTVAGGMLVGIAALEVLWIGPQIVEMFHAGRTLEPSFRSLHRLSERCGHLEVILTALVLGGQAFARDRGLDAPGEDRAPHVERSK